ncbi:hypothetical protein KS4_01840 [Poriferisphaera corsica]|uniref:Uncharacterized protein n=2 Tax=Poriferisphaera corsica TaxID=2528020 RepID=A0A517YPK4_9BACT|nr:hypothetical protein KS4_01840 [Poriferisphaera corsica]
MAAVALSLFLNAQVLGNTAQEKRALKRATERFIGRKIQKEKQPFLLGNKCIHLLKSEMKLYNGSTFESHELLLDNTSVLSLNQSIAQVEDCKDGPEILSKRASLISCGGKIQLTNNSELHTLQLDLTTERDSFSSTLVPTLDISDSKVNIDLLRGDFSNVLIDQNSEIMTDNVQFSGGIRAYAVEQPTIVLGKQSEWINTGNFILGEKTADSNYIPPMMKIVNGGTLQTKRFSTIENNDKYPVIIIDHGTFSVDELITSRDTFRFKNGELHVRKTLVSEDGLDFSNGRFNLRSESFFMHLGEIKNAHRVQVKLGKNSIVIHSRAFKPRQFASFNNLGINHQLGGALTITKDRVMKSHGVLTDPMKIYGSFTAEDDLLFRVNNRISVGRGGKLIAPRYEHRNPLEIIGGEATLGSLHTTDLKITQDGILNCNKITLVTSESLGVNQGMIRMRDGEIRSLESLQELIFRGVHFYLSGGVRSHNGMKFLPGSRLTVDFEMMKEAHKYYAEPILRVDSDFSFDGSLKIEGTLPAEKPIVLVEAHRIDTNKIKYNNRKYKLEKQPHNGMIRLYLTYRVKTRIRNRTGSFEN